MIGYFYRLIGNYLPSKRTNGINIEHEVNGHPMGLFTSFQIQPRFVRYEDKLVCNEIGKNVKLNIELGVSNHSSKALCVQVF